MARHAFWKPLLLAAVTFTVAGCYHQVVRTGAPPGPTVIERPWTATYLLGLVPAQTISTITECPSGVAIVETRQTFVNGLVGALTLGIYTPQTVTITCAGSNVAGTERPGIELPPGAGPAERAALVRKAIRRSRRTGEPVALETAR